MIQDEMTHFHYFNVRNQMLPEMKHKKKKNEWLTQMDIPL